MNSINTLRINSIDVERFIGANQRTIAITAMLSFSILYVDPLTGQQFKEVILNYEGQGHDQIDAFKHAVQQLIDGKLDNVSVPIYDIPFHCKISPGIHSVDYSRIQSEEWVQFFKDLFNYANWSIPKMLST